MTWQKLSSKNVFENRYMSVTEDEVKTEQGNKITFGVVHKNPGVSIIPWDGKYLTLVGQYRYPVDYFSWEFPAGHMEHKDIESAVRAELEEEAGLLAGKIVKIGEFHIAPGHNTQVIKFYLATELSPGKQQLETVEEGMMVKKATLSEINNMIKDGVIKDSLTIAGLKFFELFTNR